MLSWFGLSIGVKFTLLGGILLAAVLLFRVVKLDYLRRGGLSHGVAVIQTAFFALYALASYVFLDSRFSAIDRRLALLVPATLLMLVGLLLVLGSMPILGKRSFGHETGTLHTTGLYRWSRNPQLAGGFLVVLGYAMLWPSIAGFFWAALWIPISHLMVSAEEPHLLAVFGEAYSAYCSSTPRYIGLPSHQEAGHRH